MKSSSGAINIAASARRLDVDNRISLRCYYRIADNLIKQADIYRKEKNIIDLYVMLLRFSSLITETIPFHQDYQLSLQSEKLHFRKILLNALGELEILKPDVQRRLEELNSKSRNQVSRWAQAHTKIFEDSFEWPLVKKQTPRNDESRQAFGINGSDCLFRDPVNQWNKFSHSKSISQQFHKLSLSIPCPKEETLSRHSILGPNGLHGQWQPPTNGQGIQYPSNLDFTPIVIPSLQQAEYKPGIVDNNDTLDHERSTREAVLSLHDERLFFHAEEPSATTSLDVPEVPKIDILSEPSPPPVLAEVQELVAVPPQESNSISREMMSLQNDLLHAESPLQVHISTTMLESFMRLAKSNTERNLETCGVLAGSLKNKNFYITALIIPKQESTSDSCQTTNEEEIFDYQDEKSLFPLGWIHTHPSQSCFMSSIDVHTHYSYQTMLPEAIAIVMAPKDTRRRHGIFRLTSPGGMSVIRNCQQRGFHPHQEPPDGGPIYDHCSDVYMNPSLKFDVVDLR